MAVVSCNLYFDRDTEDAVRVWQPIIGTATGLALRILPDMIDAHRLAFDG